MGSAALFARAGRLNRAFAAFRADNATRSAAALAYYTIFSIVPVLLIIIAVAGLVFGKRAGRAEVLEQAGGVLGTAAADAIREMLDSAANRKAGIAATLAGTITFLFGAAGVFGELRGALNQIWKRTQNDTTTSVPRFIVIAVALLMFVSLLFDATITAIARYAAGNVRGGEWLWKPLQLAASILVATLLFAIIFRFARGAQVSWREVSIGAGVTAVLFVLGKFALGLYLTSATVGSGFGAAGSIIVVLVWVYWSALIFLFGVELTAAGHPGSVAASS